MYNEIARLSLACAIAEESDRACAVCDATSGQLEEVGHGIVLCVACLQEHARYSLAHFYVTIARMRHERETS